MFLDELELAEAEQHKYDREEGLDVPECLLPSEPDDSR